MKEMKKEVDRFCGKYQPSHISPHLPLSFSVGKENFHPALVILSLSGQIGSAQWAPLLFAVMFETDKSGQTSMEKSQSSERLRRKAYVIAGQQHLNRLAGFLLLTQSSDVSLLKWEQWGIWPASGGERSSALHHSNNEQHQMQEKFASPTARHKSVNHQIFTGEQILFNPALIPLGTILHCSWTLQDTLDSITHDQTKCSPYPPGRVHHLYRMLPYRARNNPKG